MPPIPWKLIIPAGAAALLIFLLFLLIKSISSWSDRQYSLGFEAGAKAVETEYAQSEAEGAKQALSRFVARVEKSNRAVEDYVQRVAARQPSLQQISEEIEKYAKSDSASELCLDPSGVSIVEGLFSSASPAGRNPRPPD